MRLLRRIINLGTLAFFILALIYFSGCAQENLPQFNPSPENTPPITAPAPENTPPITAPAPFYDQKSFGNEVLQ